MQVTVTYDVSIEYFYVPGELCSMEVNWRSSNVSLNVGPDYTRNIIDL